MTYLTCSPPLSVQRSHKDSKRSSGYLCLLLGSHLVLTDTLNSTWNIRNISSDPCSCEREADSHMDRFEARRKGQLGSYLEKDGQYLFLLAC